MGAVAPTRFSRISVGFRDSNRSLVDLDPGDTGRDFSCINGASTGSFAVGGALGIGGAFTGATTGVFSSTLSVGGAVTLDAGVTALSTVTVAGNLTASGGILVGNAAAINELVAISSATAAIDLAAINPLESSSVHTFGLSGLTRGDTLIVTPDANWSLAAAHTDLSYFASSSSTAGEGNFWAINSTLTAVNAGDTVFRFTRINHPSYL